MKKKILLTVLFFGITILFQGCYTILDLPEADSSDYVTTVYVQEVFYPAPVPVPPPVIVVPPSYSDQPVTTNPPTKDRTNDIGSIRNDGNGRGNTTRDVSFSSGNNTSSNNSSTSSNNNSGSSSNVRNSGNGRR